MLLNSPTTRNNMSTVPLTVVVIVTKVPVHKCRFPLESPGPGGAQTSILSSTHR